MKLSLFGQKKTTAEVAVMDAPKKYSDDIEKIHHEFEVAAELLYQEAVAIITGVGPINEAKANRLKALGFSAVPEVTEVDSKKKKIEVSLATKELISAYRREYPMNKFITEDQVKQICQKYGLVWGNLSRFKGFVPEVNLVMIEKFTKKYKFNSVVISRNSSLSDGMIVSPKEIKIIKPGERDDIENYRTDEYGFIHLIFDDGSSLRLQQNSRNWDGINFYGTPRKNSNLSQQFDLIYASIISLQIAAPEKDFDMKGMTVKNHQIVKQVPDPVVLQPVKGGYLIVTAWGDEASDPLVVNEINN